MESLITSEFHYTRRFCFTFESLSSKIQLKSVLEASWRDLGGILGVSWLHFSSQNGPWRHLGGFLEASWGCLGDLFDLRSIFLLILEGLCDQLGSILVPKTGLCDQLGPILAPKTDPKARNSDFPYKNLFFIVFGFHFRGVQSLKS